MFLKCHLSSILFLLIFLSQTENLPDSLLFDRGYREFLKKEWESAEKYLSQHFELYPASQYRAQVLYLLGETKFKQGQYSKAIEYWNYLQEKYPESSYKIEVIEKIGDAYFNSGKYELALKAYKKLKDFNPDKKILLEVNLKIDESLYYLGQYKSLVDALYHFIDANPDTFDSSGIMALTMMRITRIHLEKKEYYSALVLLDRLQETYPETPIMYEVLFERANIYKLLGDRKGYKNALLSLVAKGKKSELYTYAIIDLANLYLEEQKYDSSLYYWGILSRENEKFNDLALKQISEIYYKIGQEFEAIVVIQSLIDKFPHSKFIADAYILQAKIFKNQGDFQQVIKTLKALQTKSDLEPAIFVKIGNIYSEIEEYDSAIETYLMASESFKDQRDESARALVLAGDAAYAKGDKVNARRYYLHARLIAVSEEVKNLAGLKINQLE